MNEVKYGIFVFLIYLAVIIFANFLHKVNSDSSLLIFLLGCCVVPFYYAHFLSGYIVGLNNVADRFNENLLVNIKFLKYLYDGNLVVSSKLMVIEFFLSYVGGVVGIVVAFVLRN
ncbi:hypothetical protein [Delftia acidovorans]|uniref:hypothetical protein n=2 Tax=Bacteria TaxID=2 RepID=UPI00241C57DD|nr:hypothetical protein [Delftia acidovorans]